MKPTSHWKPAFLTALLTLFTAGASLAQSQMNYQGRLTEPNGNAVPDAQYPITFHIYDLATGGTNKWGPQVITADVVQGRFNVILGPTDTASRNIVSAFDGGTRYLQITYQGNPILPRQQILSSPTAFFAQNAGQLANVYVLNGNVGIGTPMPGFPLNFANTTGDKISLFGNSGNSSGFGIQGNLLQIHTDVAVADIAFGYGSSAAMTETMRIKGNGNVGIGTTTPFNKLDVANGGIIGNNSGGTGSFVDNSARGVKVGFGFQSSAGDFIGMKSVIVPSLVNPYNDGDLQFFTWANSISNGEVMRIKGNGKVGIGTNNRANKLTVVDDGPFSIVSQAATAIGNNGFGLANSAGQFRCGFSIAGQTGNFFPGAAPGDAILGSVNGAKIMLGFDNTAVMTIATSGNVGIGTTTPTQAKLVVDGTGASYNLGTVGYLTTSGNTGSGGANAPLSIYTTGQIAAGGGYYAHSDERIKRVKGRSDAAADLAALQSIEVTDYTYIDAVSKGGGTHKKVIAQQTEKVFPQAVAKSTDVVPDIYQKATVQDGWVALATDLKVGERVRLIGEKEEGIHEVLEVRDGAFQPATDAVFVYGREVKDFRNVDYEAIAMLNVSATQELARKLEAQSAESTQLRAALTKLRAEKHALAQEVAALTARDQTREARLTRLETALAPAPARTVSASLDLK